MNSIPDTADASNSVQTVVFALRILEHMAGQKEAVRITDLAAHFNTTKTRIFRHLRTLVQAGYMIQDEESERYQVGSRLIALGLLVGGNFDISSVSQPLMRVLRDRVNHSVVLGVPAADGIHIITVVHSTAPIEITVRPGSVLGFHYSAQGKIALAYGDSTWMAEALGSDLSRNTPQTIHGAGALEKEIARIRRCGWAEAPNEAVIGLNALAAPVFDAGGGLAATVALVDSVQFLPEQATDTEIEALRACASAISKKLGYQDSLPGPG